jgi:hypothetical protein
MRRENKLLWACLISLKAPDGLACYQCCRIGGDTSPILAALTE